MAPGPDATAHQRTSRLLAAESLGSIPGERRDAELRERPRTPRPNPALAAVQGQAAQLLRYEGLPTMSRGNSWPPRCGPLQAVPIVHC